MARQGWTTRTATAAGVAAGSGAAQLGIGYGLGIVLWPDTPTTGDAVWLASLAWAVWITAGATVLGAVAARRVGATPHGRIGALARLVLVLAAA
ncbi:MAG TPA: Hansenula MRAKII killer toxin-resistant protein 1, partial [Actinoplanes sp.]|nr:Hansenula MRAKII killer toxin-resistant protein 1 [Actinoplanes sp.]